MTDNMISIIIPTHNRLELLKKVLPYYIKQKFINEIIIVDDCSTDGTEFFIVNNYPKIKYIKLKNRSGAPIAKQIGLNNATSDYVLFGEDDLYFDIDYSEILLKHLQKQNADIIAGRIIYLKKNETKYEALKRNDVRTTVLYDKDFNNNFNSILDDDKEVLFLHGCFMGKRDILTKFKYDKNFRVNGWREETDYLIQIKESGYKIIFCPHTICFHLCRENDAGGQHSYSRFKYEYWVYKNNYYFYKKHFSFFKENKLVKMTPYLYNNIYFIRRLSSLVYKKLKKNK